MLQLLVEFKTINSDLAKYWEIFENKKVRVFSVRGEKSLRTIEKEAIMFNDHFFFIKDKNNNNIGIIMGPLAEQEYEPFILNASELK